MPAGLQCLDAAGNITADITDRYSRLLGWVEVTGPTGTITHPAFATGSIWFTVVSDGLYTPNVTIDEVNHKIEYTPGPPVGSSSAIFIFYGVY